MYIIFISSVLSSFSWAWGGGGEGGRYYHLAVNGHKIKHCLFGWNVLSSSVGQRLHFKFYALLCERFGFSVHTSKILSLLPIFRIGRKLQSVKRCVKCRQLRHDPLCTFSLLE